MKNIEKFEENNNSLELVKKALNKNSEKQDVDLFDAIRNKLTNQTLQQNLDNEKVIEMIKYQNSLHYKFLENHKIINSPSIKKLAEAKTDKLNFSIGDYVLIGILSLVGLYITAYALVMIPILFILYIVQSIFSKRNY